MELNKLYRLCQFLSHPFRKKLKVGTGSVCLFCRVNRGRYYPYRTKTDKFYDWLFDNKEIHPVLTVGESFTPKSPWSPCEKGCDHK